jgi:aminoglycoside phosphotransferase (APT) family kinase protein
LLPDGANRQSRAARRSCEGEILRELETAALDGQQLFACHRRMGQVLREIHHITLVDFGCLGPHGRVEAAPPNRAYMPHQFDRHLADCLGRGDCALAERMRPVIRERAILFDACGEACLCHFDFRSGNVLAERRPRSPRVSGILDFGGAIAAPGTDEPGGVGVICDARSARSSGFTQIERDDKGRHCCSRV